MASNFVRIGNALINLDNVRCIMDYRKGPKNRIQVLFEDRPTDDDSISITGAQADAFMAYMERMTPDVLDWYAKEFPNKSQEE